jgi:hypothetical protein
VNFLSELLQRYLSAHLMAILVRGITHGGENGWNLKSGKLYRIISG